MLNKIKWRNLIKEVFIIQCVTGSNRITFNTGNYGILRTRLGWSVNRK